MTFPFQYQRTAIKASIDSIKYTIVSEILLITIKVINNLNLIYNCIAMFSKNTIVLVTLFVSISIGILANVNSQKQKILIPLCCKFNEDQNALVYIGKWACLLPESIG